MPRIASGSCSARARARESRAPRPGRRRRGWRAPWRASRTRPVRRRAGRRRPPGAGGGSRSSCSLSQHRDWHERTSAPGARQGTAAACGGLHACARAPCSAIRCLPLLPALRYHDTTYAHAIRVARDPRLPDERGRFREDGRHPVRRGLPARRLARGGRRHPDQHLQHPRQGRAEGLQPRRPLRAAQAPPPGHAARAHRLRRAEARRRRARAAAGGRRRRRDGAHGRAAGAARAGARHGAAGGRHRRGQRRRAPRRAGARQPHQGLDQRHVRLRQPLRLLRGAPRPRARAQPPPDGGARRGRGARARRVPRGDAARAERQLVRPRPRAGRRFRRAAARDRRHGRRPAGPVHHLAPEGLLDRPDARGARSADGLRGGAPAAAGRRRRRARADEPRLHAGALPPDHRRAAGDRPGRRGDHRHHRRLPGGERRGLRRHA